MSVPRKDVVIAGGGLAGLGLAKQLVAQRPDLDIAVVERARFPLNDTTPKVGESTVEIASRYLVDTLDLGDHFKEQHLQKFGLRCFFGTPQADFSQYDELGASNRFPLPTYQLERGVLENHLYAELTASGVQIDDGASIQDAKLDDADKRLKFVDASGAAREYQSRWLVDCAGRFGLLRRSLNLNKSSEHRGNAVWFRVDRTLKIDEWTENKDWQSRVALKGRRWLSTNHLMGPGYWIWIIPLASGATSLGIVMDDQAWASAGLVDYSATEIWLARHHPQLADHLAGVKVLDFVSLEDYSFAAKRCFSADGWAMSGEAGVFADPFYSPGSDFIGIANDIISHLVVRQSQGDCIGQDTRILDTFFRGFFENTVSLYRGEYGGWGDRVMMSAKLTWDYCFYWGVLALLYYRGAVTDAGLLRSINPQLTESLALNAKMQAAFRDRAKKRLVVPARGMFIDQYEVPVLQALMGQLKDSDVTLASALTHSMELIRAVAPDLIAMVSDCGSAESRSDTDLLGTLRRAI